MSAPQFFLLALVSALFVASALSCSIPPGGCSPGSCARLTSLKTTDYLNPLYGFYMGKWNKHLDKSLESQIGGPVANYEVYKEIGYNGTILATTTDNTLGECCNSCAFTYGCTMYQFFMSPNVTRGKRTVPGFKTGTQCYLLYGGSDFTKNKMWGTPTSGAYSIQKKNARYYDLSWVGGMCNLCFVPNKVTA